MLKKFFSIAAVAMLFAACQVVEVEVESVPGLDSAAITVGASFENNLTKSDISDAGAFTWSEGDGIKVLSNTGYWNTLDILTGYDYCGPRFSNAYFSATTFMGNRISTAAVFPKTIEPVYKSGTLTLGIPVYIGWNDATVKDDSKITMQADNIMVARGFEDGASSIDFKNVGGLFRLTLCNVPATASKLVFTTNKKINGSFVVDTVEENNESYPVIRAGDSYSSGENAITIGFTTLLEASDMVFFIPVPVGEYQIGFAVKDDNNTTLWEFNSSANNRVERAHMKKMPALTYMVTVGGGGEGSTNIIVTPTSFSGDVFMPNTTSNIYVQMHETDGTINLKYSSDPAAKHPANVYLQALGNIKELNIDLPDSHVELTGSGNIETIECVHAYTAINTLVIDSSVQIGAGEEDHGLTVTGGSLVLNAPVAGTVSVNIPDKNVNSSDKKVSIEINSAINNLEVPKAATKNNPDKVWVSINSGASVTTAIDVDETNCNLYIAPQASATTVNTSAEENTISGSVTTLSAQPKQGAEQPTEVNVTVNGTVSVLNATGAATAVVVEKEGSVTTSISSTNSAAVVVVERTEEEVENKEAGSVTANTNTATQGTITTVENNIVALIGGSPFSSLDAAFEAAKNGDTITLIADCSFSETALVNTKEITLDLGSHNIQGNVSDYMIQNQGTLTINASASKPGKVYNLSIAAQGHGAILNDTEGTIIINGGIFGDVDDDPTNTGTVNSGCAFRNRGTATVNGGIFTTAEPDYDSSIWAYAIVSGESDIAANITINGGRIYGRHGDICNNHGTMIINDVTTYGTANYYSIYAWKEGTTTVNGGSFIKNNPSSKTTLQFYADEASARILVKGGNFTKNTTGNFAGGSGNVELQGGTFSRQPEAAIVSAGYEAIHTGEVWIVAPVTGVAAIGKTGYSSLAAAIAAAQNGETVTLLKNITLSENLVIGGTYGDTPKVTTAIDPVNITLDLNGYNISGDKTIYLAGGSLNITGTGTIETTGSGVAAVGIRYVKTDGYSDLDYASKRTLTVGQNVTLRGPYGINVFGTNEGTVANNIEVNVNGTIVGDVFVLGNLTNTANNININVNGTIDATTTSMNGIALNGYANVIVSENALVQGLSGIEVRAGRLTVNGGTVRGTSSPASVTSNGSGTTSQGVGIAVSQHGTKLPIDVVVTGGIVEGHTGLYVVNPENNSAADMEKVHVCISGGTFSAINAGVNAVAKSGSNIDSASLSLTGGTYSSDPSAYCALGYCATQSGNVWIVNPAVASIGDSYYNTLHAAIAAVPSTGMETTVTMRNNTTVDVAATPITIAASKNVVLELNGKQIVGTCSSSGSSALITNNGTLVIQDNTDSQNDGSGDGKIITGANPTWTWDGTDDYSGSYASNVVTNRGNLTINSGYLENISTGSAVYALDNYTNGITTINGGTLKAVSTTVRLFLNSTSNPNTIVMKGGKIIGNNGISFQNSNANANRGSLTVTGGSISATNDAIYLYSYNEDGSNMSLNLNGGVISGKYSVLSYSGTATSGLANISITGGTYNNWLYLDGGNVSIENGIFNAGVTIQKYYGGETVANVTGGTFVNDPSAYVSAGYGVTYNSTTAKWTVGPATLTWDGVSTAEPTYLDDETYGIFSAAQLAGFAAAVNNGTNYSGKTVKLMNNIDLNNKAWTPIGLGGNSDKDDKGSETGCFLGTFDGQNHTISNLTATHNNDDRSFAGLFGTITVASEKTVTIKDLAVSNVAILSNHMAAGILARYYGKVTNARLVISGCTVTGGFIASRPFLNSQNVYESGNQAAGIVGNAYGKGITITNCAASDLAIYAARDIAGIAGNLESTGVSAFSNNSVANINITRLITAGYEKQEGDSSLQTIGVFVGRGGYIPDESNSSDNVTISDPLPDYSFVIGGGESMVEGEEEF